MTEVNVYIFAFMDFQKHGKREENNLLRILTQEEIKEAQRCLDLTVKQTTTQNIIPDGKLISEVIEFKKLISKVNNIRLEPMERKIIVYDMDKDEFNEKNLREIVNDILNHSDDDEVSWDENGNLK